MSFLNTSEAIFEGEGLYDIPKILPVEDVGVSSWDMFENARTAKPQKDTPASLDYRQDIGVHFFQDDHKFEIVWQKPHKHLEKLKLYGCVLAPDFSLYTDFPIAVQIMQTYKKHWVARFWQEQGLKVIPTVCWSTPDSYDFCFDGDPIESVVAVSNIGCTRVPEVKALFDVGYQEMLRRLNPSKVLFFTYQSEELNYEGNVEYINIKKQKNFER